MAPEQIHRRHASDHRADLYSLAVVLYRCLSGRLPFQSDQQGELLSMQLYDAPPQLQVEGLSLAPLEAYRALLAEMLNKAPLARPESAREVHERLKRIERLLPSPADIADRIYWRRLPISEPFSEERSDPERSVSLFVVTLTGELYQGLARESVVKGETMTTMSSALSFAMPKIENTELGIGVLRAESVTSHIRSRGIPPGPGDRYAPQISREELESMRARPKTKRRGPATSEYSSLFDEPKKNPEPPDTVEHARPLSMMEARSTPLIWQPERETQARSWLPLTLLILAGGGGWIALSLSAL